MRALTLYEAGKMEIRDIPRPTPGPDEILVQVGAVGLCGTDFHIFEGHANYHTDASGRIVPLQDSPQILGHEFCGRVAELGANVRNLQVGDRVIIDQGYNCRSWGRAELCEYCATGNTHQCAEYAEHGITGLQGALAEAVAVPAVNAVRIETDMPMEEAALVEPLGCIIHSSDMVERATARYRFRGERPIRNVLIVGAGPAGLLFTQYLRKVIGFDGLLLVSEPNGIRRRLAEEFGATTIDPTAVDVIAAVQDLTGGEKIHYLIEAAGIAPVFRQIPGLLRKQATILLYGHGHHGVDLGVLNNVQFIEPTLVSPVGASGELAADGQPQTYRRALELVADGSINVARIVTHRYRLEDVPRAFATDHYGTDFIKGVALLS
jgi:threonine dehydrogenase-like Zn-dependent dehydrogenase